MQAPGFLGRRDCYNEQEIACCTVSSLIQEKFKSKALGQTSKRDHDYHLVRLLI